MEKDGQLAPDMYQNMNSQGSQDMYGEPPAQHGPTLTQQFAPMRVSESATISNSFSQGYNPHQHLFKGTWPIPNQQMCAHQGPTIGFHYTPGVSFHYHVQPGPAHGIPQIPASQQSNYAVSSSWQQTSYTQPPFPMLVPTHHPFPMQNASQPQTFPVPALPAHAINHNLQYQEHSYVHQIPQALHQQQEPPQQQQQQQQQQLQPIQSATPPSPGPIVVKLSDVSETLPTITEALSKSSSINSREEMHAQSQRASLASRASSVSSLFSDAHKVHSQQQQQPQQQHPAAHHHEQQHHQHHQRQQHPQPEQQQPASGAHVAPPASSCQESVPSFAPAELLSMRSMRGVSEAQMFHWFQLADPGHRQQVDAANAVVFLKRSGLSTKTLAWVWDVVAVRRERTLCPLEFSFALRLVALLQHAVQQQQPVAPNICELVYAHDPPACPPPRFKDDVPFVAPSPPTNPFIHAPAPATSVLRQLTSASDPPSPTSPLASPSPAPSPTAFTSRLGRSPGIASLARASGAAPSLPGSPGRAPPAVSAAVARDSSGNSEPARAGSFLVARGAGSTGSWGSMEQEGSGRARAVLTVAAIPVGEGPPRPIPLLVRPIPLHPRRAAPLQMLVYTNQTLCAAPTSLSSGSVRVWESVDDLGLAKPPAACSRDPAVAEGDAASSVDVALAGVATTANIGAVTCMYANDGVGALWTGHSEGYVQARKISGVAVSSPWLVARKRGVPIKATPASCWQAFRSGATVSSMVVTPDQSVWVGNSGGQIRVFSISAEDVGEVGERCVDLARGAGRAHAAGVAFLVAPRGGLFVWSAGGPTVNIWDARSRKHIRQYSEDDDDEEDEGGEKAAKVERKVKKGGLLKGMVKAWTTVQSKASEMIDHKLLPHVKGMVTTADGCVWIAYADGKVEQVTADGKGLGEIVPFVACATSMVAVGTRVWVGYEDGTVYVLSANEGEGEAARKPTGRRQRRNSLIAVPAYAGRPSGSSAPASEVKLHTWKAHSSAVVAMTFSGARVFTLAADGDVLGWNAQLGCVAGLGKGVAAALERELIGYGSTQEIRVLAGTWNVNEMRPRKSAFKAWLGQVAHKVDLVCVGLQEMEMGGSSLISAGAKEMFAKDLQEKGNDVANWWCSEMMSALEEGCILAGDRAGRAWSRVGTRQMSGMLVAVFVRQPLAKEVGEAHSAAVPTGVMGVGGNKGAVAVRFMLFRRTFTILCSHFAAHQNAVAKRNEDYRTICSSLAFEGSCVPSVVAPWLAKPPPQAAPEGSALREAEVLIWVGDFNYRIEMSYEEALAAINLQKQGLQELHEHDQLDAERQKGAVFVGFQEGYMCFPPTYKFDKGTSIYDTSEKKRVPSWTDRVLYRLAKPWRRREPLAGEEEVREMEEYNGAEESCGPLGWCRNGALAVQAHLKRYESVPDVEDSDHKPVRGVLAVRLLCINESARRLVHLQAEQEDMIALSQQTVLKLSTTTLTMTETGCDLELSVPSEVSFQQEKYSGVAFEVLEVCKSETKPLAEWLVATPVCGLISPGTSVCVHLSMSEDASSCSDLPTDIMSLDRVLCIRYNADAGSLNKIEECIKLDIPSSLSIVKTFMNVSISRVRPNVNGNRSTKRFSLAAISGM